MWCLLLFLVYFRQTVRHEREREKRGGGGGGGGSKRERERERERALQMTCIITVKKHVIGFHIFTRTTVPWACQFTLKSSSESKYPCRPIHPSLSWRGGRGGCRSRQLVSIHGLSPPSHPHRLSMTTAGLSVWTWIRAETHAQPAQSAPLTVLSNVELLLVGGLGPHGAGSKGENKA